MSEQLWQRVCCSECGAFQKNSSVMCYIRCHFLRGYKILLNHELWIITYCHLTILYLSKDFKFKMRRFKLAIWRLTFVIFEWLHSFPKTNVLWLQYLVDILLLKKSYVSLLFLLLKGLILSCSFSFLGITDSIPLFKE